MKIGLIYCGWGMKDLVQESIQTWIQAKAMLGAEIVICALSLRFKGFDGQDDGTQEYLRELKKNGDIDNLIDSPGDIPETQARTLALKWLLEQGVDTIWMADADELITQFQISAIIDCVKLNPWVDWFRLSYKNYVFDRQTYLVEPFTPPRIFRVTPNRYSPLTLSEFYQDNDIGYRDKKEPNGALWPQNVFVSRTINHPDMHIKHITWQNDERGHKKVEYQTKGRGWNCSFRWNDGLEFNPEYYKEIGEPFPEIRVDN